jgi:hypothetical protein
VLRLGYANPNAAILTADAYHYKHKGHSSALRRRELTTGMSRGTQFCWCMGACSGIVVLPRLNTKKANESTMTAHAMNTITPLHCFPTINLVLSRRV